MKLARYLLALVFFAAIIVLVVMWSGGNALIFIDLPSSILVVLGGTAVLRATWTFRDMGRAFAAPFRSAPGSAELEGSRAFFQQMRKVLYALGGLAAFLGTVNMLINLSDRTRIGPNLAMALLAILYAFILDLAVALPLGAAADKAMKDMSGS